jgi:hypothetical protein
LHDTRRLLDDLVHGLNLAVRTLIGLGALACAFYWPVSFCLVANGYVL